MVSGKLVAHQCKRNTSQHHTTMYIANIRVQTHFTGIALSHAISEYQRGFAMGLRAVRRVTITIIQPKN